MSFFDKLRGTIESIFQIGLGGPQVKNNAGALEARDPADAAFVVVRGATPLAANDLTTKAYVDAAVDPGAVRAIRYAITNAASQDSVTVIPAGAVVLRASVEVVTPFSAGATIEVGQAGSLTLLELPGDNLATSAGIYQVPQDTPWGAAALAVRTTVGGAPAAGAGFVFVEYALAGA